MKMPILDGLIDRRILINYRVDPDIIRRLLPGHLDPLIINGYASAGICLLRLKNIGIKGSPSLARFTSENTAHRFLVKYKSGELDKPGVYIPRRDTDSLLNVVLAGKVLSWPHYPASFQSLEANGSYSVAMESKDDHAHLAIDARLATTFPVDSMFDNLEHASRHFEACSLGISPSNAAHRFKYVELRTRLWNVKPLEVLKLVSSYFEDRRLFPLESIQFDNALLMEGIEHEWIIKTQDDL